MLPIRPLLSQKNEVRWAPEHQSAFEEACTALSGPITLPYQDPSTPSALPTEASRRKGLGFVFRQQQENGTWCVDQCGSRFLSDTESRYAVIEVELQGLCWATRKCHVFLKGLSQFQVILEHQPLIRVLNSKQLDEIENLRLLRLRMKLMGYNFITS